MSSSSSAESTYWPNLNFPTPIPFNDHVLPAPMSPLSPLTNASLSTQPRRRSRGKGVHTHRYNKQEMVYRAIDEKIDLVRFLQAYESVVSAFGVGTSIDGVDGFEDRSEDTEIEREKLEVAERIVYRLFWNDRIQTHESSCESVPLLRDSTDNLVMERDNERVLRVTSSEMDAISKIVDEGYEGLQITAGSSIDNGVEKNEMTSTVTKAKEVTDEIDVSIDGDSADGIAKEGLCDAEPPKINAKAKRGRMTSMVTELVETHSESDTSLVGKTSSESLDEKPSIAAVHVASDIDTTHQISSNGFCLAIRPKADQSMREDPSTGVVIKPKIDLSQDDLHDRSLTSPRSLLLKRWGRDRYAEWDELDSKASSTLSETAKKEAFRLTELKHRLLPLESGKLPYTYRIISSTQKHRDSYTGRLWGFDAVHRTEELLHVRLLWTCGEGFYNDITVEPRDVDEFARDEGRGRELLGDALGFLGFWDDAIRRDVDGCSINGKVKPMNAILLHWRDPDSYFHKRCFEKIPDSNSSEKIIRGGEGGGRRDRDSEAGNGNWREKRVVSGASYVGGKKRTVSGNGGWGTGKGKGKGQSGSGGWNGGKKRTVSGNCCRDRKLKEDRTRTECYENKGLRNVRRRKEGNLGMLERNAE